MNCKKAAIWMRIQNNKTDWCFGSAAMITADEANYPLKQGLIPAPCRLREAVTLVANRFTYILGGFHYEVHEKKKNHYFGSTRRVLDVIKCVEHLCTIKIIS
ncbi:hypothetical protein FACS1894200_14160 [Spirochaetia bacterium]|nr:hypothetical protein FACS1894200_14160 [Spirochaetia bacterium]